MFNIFKKLDEIINKTIVAIDQSKTEIFEIAEMARAEYARIENQLVELKQATEKVINQVDEKDKPVSTRQGAPYGNKPCFW